MGECPCVFLICSGAVDSYFHICLSLVCNGDECCFSAFLSCFRLRSFLRSHVSRVLTANGLVYGNPPFSSPQNRHPLTDCQKIVTGDYVHNFYSCAKFGGNTSMGGFWACLLYTSPSPRDRQKSRMPSSA